MYRQHAEISGLSSGDLNKYEYLTKKKLNYKPDPLQKAKFEYSPLGQVFNKGLKTDEGSEELLKRLKNIEDETDNLNINAVNDSNKLKKIDFYNPRSDKSRKSAQEINKIIDETKKIKNTPRDEITRRYQPKVTFIRANGDTDYFDKYLDAREFGRDIQNGLITLNKAKQLQKDMKKEINDLKGYTTKYDRAKKAKERLLKNVKLPYDGIKDVIKGFEDGDFLIKDFSKQVEEDKQDEQPSTSKDGEESEESDKKINLDWLQYGTKE